MGHSRIPASSPPSLLCCPALCPRRGQRVWTAKVGRYETFVRVDLRSHPVPTLNQHDTTTTAVRLPLRCSFVH